jgi:hypothetical protein
VGQTGRGHFPGPHFAQNPLQNRGLLTHMLEIQTFQYHAGGFELLIVTRQTILANQGTERVWSNVWHRRTAGQVAGSRLRGEKRRKSGYGEDRLPSPWNPTIQSDTPIQLGNEGG